MRLILPEPILTTQGTPSAITLVGQTSPHQPSTRLFMSSTRLIRNTWWLIWLGSPASRVELLSLGPAPKTTLHFTITGLPSDGVRLAQDPANWRAIRRSPIDSTDWGADIPVETSPDLISSPAP